MKAGNPYVMKNIFKNGIPYLIYVIQGPVNYPICRHNQKVSLDLSLEKSTVRSLCL